MPTPERRANQPEGHPPLVYVIPTDEERMIAPHTLAVVGTHAAARPQSGRKRERSEDEMFEPKAQTLEGKKGLVIGIANDQSIAYGCAKAFKFLGPRTWRSPT